MNFTHPLARGAKIAVAKLHDGTEQRLLVIVTTAELDAKSDKFKQKTVDRLSEAAREYIVASSSADGFVLINRLREWARPSV